MCPVGGPLASSAGIPTTLLALPFGQHGVYDLDPTDPAVFIDDFNSTPRVTAFGSYERTCSGLSASCQE